MTRYWLPFWIWAAILLLAGMRLAGAQSNPYPTGGQSVINQGYRSVAITPSDTDKIPVTRAIFNGNDTACDITMQLNGDSAALVWHNVQIGQFLPVQAVLVKTATTCSNLIAIY